MGLLVAQDFKVLSRGIALSGSVLSIRFSALGRRRPSQPVVTILLFDLIRIIDQYDESYHGYDGYDDHDDPAALAPERRAPGFRHDHATSPTSPSPRSPV